MGVVVAAALLVLCVRADGGLPGDPFSPEPVEVLIGPSVYAIPRNYLVHVSTDFDGETGSVVMRALWPGLEPLRRDNALLWERRQPERQIHFGLMRRPRDGYRELRGLAELRKIEPEQVEFGLTRYRSHLVEYYAGDEPEHRSPNGSPVALKCFDYPENTKTRFEVERNCIVEYPLNDRVGLHYRFFMINLEHWREIDQSMRTLIEGFLRPKEVE